MILESLLHALCINKDSPLQLGRTLISPSPIWALDVFQLTAPLSLSAWLFWVLFYVWVRNTFKRTTQISEALSLCSSIFSGSLPCKFQLLRHQTRQWLRLSSLDHGSERPLGRKPRWFYILSCFLSLMDQKNYCFTHFVQFSSCFWWEVKSGTSFSIIAGSRNSQRPYLKSWYPAISWTNTTLHYEKAQNITNEMKPILRYITVKLQKNKTF